RLCEDLQPRVASPALAPEFETLVITPGKPPLAYHRARAVFERDVLPPFLARSRWFPDRGVGHVNTRLKSAIPLGDRDSRLELAIVETKGRRESGDYVLPIAVKWTRFDRERENPKALAAARQGPREGTLLDVAADEEFITLMLDKIRRSEDVESDGGRLEFRPGTRFPPGPIELDGPVRGIDTEQSNTTALVGSQYVAKLFRRLEPGINPEIEIGRFLTDVAGFHHTPALMGT